ncbi:MAG: hypothetical protein DRH20_12535 [Deltaproteobacteria bacterium]|nr:MAG: hypothetical protein DRH20_12535 [Deltaproteobacteria bacterium]
MSGGRMVEWLFLALTVGLMMVLKRLHYGVTHYNIFLLILLGWSLALIIAFRVLSGTVADASAEDAPGEGKQTEGT